MKIAVEDITEDFVKKHHGRFIWLRDDYLAMRNIAGPGETLDILNKVVKMKEKMKLEEN